MANFDRIPAKGKVYRFRQLLFWAQGGCVCIEDMAQEGDYRVVSRADFAARVISMRDAIAAGEFDRHPDERNAAHDFVLNGVAVVKEAKHQGDPFDPVVLAQKTRDRQTQKGMLYAGTPGRILLPTQYGGQGAATAGGRLFYPGENQKPIVLRTLTEDQAPAQAAVLPRLKGKGK